jgi:hypothetical protein
LTIIGVTGHRILTETSKIEKGVDAALAQIENHTLDPISIISSLAEGADRLVVHRALARWESARLIAALPLPLDDYMNDFNSVVSKAEFVNLLEQAAEIVTVTSTTSRAQAYADAGWWILDRCNILIAVWDGEEAQGIGGAAEIVAEARQRRLPIAWVRAGNRKPGTEEPTSFGALQGQVVYENFD